MSLPFLHVFSNGRVSNHEGGCETNLRLRVKRRFSTIATDSSGVPLITLRNEL